MYVDEFAVMVLVPSAAFAVEDDFVESMWFFEKKNHQNQCCRATPFWQLEPPLAAIFFLIMYAKIYNFDF